MYSIGVDFHKAYSYMTVVDAGGRIVKARKVANTAEAVWSFVCPYREGGQAVVEARIKTDRIDSRVLAHLLRCDLLPTAYVRPREQRTIQQALRQRMFLVRLRTMVKNRIHVLVDRQITVREMACRFSDLFGQAGLAWLRTVELPTGERQLLDRELALLDALRERVAESDGVVRGLSVGDRQVRWVRTIPGLGRVFAVLVVNEIGDVRRFATPEKLCSYAGLVPSVYASGGKVFHGRLTKQGNKWLRWAVVEAVRPAVKTDPELHAYYERLRHRRGQIQRRSRRRAGCSRSSTGVLSQSGSSCDAAIGRPRPRARPSWRPDR